MSGKGHLLLLGFGYVAGFLARQAAMHGWRVSATARTLAGLRQARQVLPRAWLFDGRSPLPRDAWRGVTHILSSIPPDRMGDPALRQLAGQLCDQAQRLQWLGYLSTVGVYGDHGGRWVDERSPCHPVTDRGRRRLAAERAWLRLHRQCGLPVHIFRLPGIYGPGRNPLLKIHRRRAIPMRAGQVFSRIHVRDLVAALLLSMARPRPGRIYNVVDDDPAPPHAVALLACDLLGMDPLPLKPIEELDLSPMARSFYTESKRVDNRRLKNELGWKPAFPSYREGLRALLVDMDGENATRRIVHGTTSPDAGSTARH